MIFVFCGTRICQASQRCTNVRVITPSCIYLWCKFPPLGRVFKIHDFFGMVLIKNDYCKYLTFNNNKRRKRLNSCIILMDYPVR